MTAAAAVARALSGDAAITVHAAAPIDAVVAHIRGLDSPFVLIVIDADLPAIDRLAMIAVMPALAIERAPAGRIGALDIAAGADESSIVAAARFLAGAESTTGQVLAITKAVNP